MAQHGQSAPLAGPQLGSCASSGHAWRLRAARHSQKEADPLGAQAPPRLLELAAAKAAEFTAFDHAVGAVVFSGEGGAASSKRRQVPPSLSAAHAAAHGSRRPAQAALWQPPSAPLFRATLT